MNEREPEPLKESYLPEPHEVELPEPPEGLDEPTGKLDEGDKDAQVLPAPSEGRARRG